MLKWIGSKFRMAEQIASYVPEDVRVFRDVFLGSASVLATVSPERGVGSDVFLPLVQIWQTVRSDPEEVKRWYRDRWERSNDGNKLAVYESIKADFNKTRSPADFLFLTRACYGGVVRFRKRDGYMSTPCGPHNPIKPDSFDKRVEEWHARLIDCEIVHSDYRHQLEAAAPGDVCYCDPPYSDTQSILYGAQSFSLRGLLRQIRGCKDRGVRVMLSIDGTKKSGNTICNVSIPTGLFEREIRIEVGRSMLRRFQMQGKSLETEVVTDRLLLTF